MLRESIDPETGAWTFHVGQVRLVLVIIITVLSSVGGAGWYARGLLYDIQASIVQVSHNVNDKLEIARAEYGKVAAVQDMRLSIQEHNLDMLTARVNNMDQRNNEQNATLAAMSATVANINRKVDDLSQILFQKYLEGYQSRYRKPPAELP